MLLYIYWLVKSDGLCDRGQEKSLKLSFYFLLYKKREKEAFILLTEKSSFFAFES